MSVSLPENAQIEKLFLSLPFFGGVPYISTRVVPALYHITLLPLHWIWEHTGHLATWPLWERIMWHITDAVLAPADVVSKTSMAALLIPCGLYFLILFGAMHKIRSARPRRSA
jgi:hypothetical protein